MTSFKNSILRKVKWFLGFIMCSAASVSGASPSVESHARDVVAIFSTHPGPGSHFGAYIPHLRREVDVVVIAGEGGKKNIEAAGETITFDIDQWVQQIEKNAVKDLTEDEQKALIQEIIKTCTAARAVMIDVGHSFSSKLHEAFTKELSNVEIISCYDNPEHEVPPPYSEEVDRVAKIMSSAQNPWTVLYANTNLIQQGITYQGRPINLSRARQCGTGYYSLQSIETIVSLCQDPENKQQFRQKVLEAFSLKDEGQRLMIYFGGANQEYIDEAFPLCCSIFSNMDPKSVWLSNTVFILLQHERAYTDYNNADATCLESTKLPMQAFVLTRQIMNERKISFLEAVAFADLRLYHQSSAGYLFYVAGPTFQISYVLQDALAKKGHCPVVSFTAQYQEEFVKLDQQLFSSYTERISVVKECVGFSEKWPQNVLQAIQSFSSKE